MADMAILAIFALGPIMGSLITLISCLCGFIFFCKFFLNNTNNSRFELTLISLVYFLYISYFLLNGSLVDNFSSTFIQMIPNIPLLCCAIICLSFDWENSSINSSNVGLLSTVSVFFSMIFALLLYFFFRDFQINGKSIASIAFPHGRLALFSGNPLPFSTILVACSFFGLVGYARKTAFIRAFTWLTIILAGVVVIFWTESRGSQLSFSIFLIISVLILFGQKIFSFIRSNLKFVIIALVCLLVIGSTLDPIFWNRLIDSNDALQRVYTAYYQIFASDNSRIIDSSVMLRLEFYKTAFEAFLDRPLFGYGYASIYTEIQLRNEVFEGHTFTHLHNAYFNHLVAGGVFGMIVFLLVLVIPVLILMKNHARTRDAVLFSSIILAHNVMSGVTNLYFRHDLLVSFNSILPLILFLTILGDENDKNELTNVLK